MGMKKSERSRVHAKQRRLLETKEIASITEQLPIPEKVKAKLDKASILRLAITYMRLKHCVGEDKNAKWAAGMLGNGGEARLLLETLGGFFLMVSSDMEVLYVSENVEKHMGIKQVDMISSSFLDYVFAKDHPELMKQFEAQMAKGGGTVHGLGLADGADSPLEMDISLAGTSTPLHESRRRFFIHMKCVYSQRGTFASLKANSDFMLLQCIGYLHLTNSPVPNFLAVVCRPLQPTPIMELRMDGNMFLSRHNLDMRFMYCDTRLSTLFGYEPDEVIGQSMYNYHHPGDLETCTNCHNNLMTTGASMSKYYRFLGKSNEWFWLQTRATVVYNASKYPQYIVCMNYIVSEKEGRRYLEEHLMNDNTNTMTMTPDSGSSCHRDTGEVALSRSVATSGVSSASSAELNLLDSSKSPFMPVFDETTERDASMMSLTSNISEITICNMDTIDSSSDGGRHNPGVLLSNQQPQFYIDTQGVPAGEEHETAGLSPPLNSATSFNDPLGNLWLSVHAITDPMATPIHTSEIYPTEFAEELEDMSYAHCSKLMRESTEVALRAYAADEYCGNVGSEAGAAAASSRSEWDACLAALDRQANRLYDTMHLDGFRPTKRSQSSASLAPSLSAFNSRSESICGSVVSSSGTTSSSSLLSVSQRHSHNATPATPASALGDHSVVPVLSPSDEAAVAGHPSTNSLASEGFTTSPQYVVSPRSVSPALHVHEEEDHEMEQWDGQAGNDLSVDDFCTIDDLLNDYPDLSSPLDSLPCSSAAGFCHPPKPNPAQAYYARDIGVDQPLEASPMLATIGQDHAAVEHTKSQPNAPSRSILEQLLSGDGQSRNKALGTAVAQPTAAGSSEQPAGLESFLFTDNCAASLPWNPMSGIQLYDPDEDEEEANVSFQWITNTMPNAE